MITCAHNHHSRSSTADVTRPSATLADGKAPQTHSKSEVQCDVGDVAFTIIAGPGPNERGGGQNRVAALERAHAAK
jgi:hypothetical protein